MSCAVKTLALDCEDRKPEVKNMAGRKGRSGSKPRGEFPGKSATFTTRIQPETRRALNAYAKAAHVSVSVAAERLLRAALKKPSGEARNRALAHAVELLAEQIEGETKKSWRDDAFTAQALPHGIIHLLGHFAPAHKKDAPVPRAIKDAAAKMPPAFAEHFCSPEGFAGQIAFRLIGEIKQAVVSPARISIWSMPVFRDAARPEMLALIGRDLGLTKKDQEVTPA
jgi:hypothetical protein